MYGLGTYKQHEIAGLVQSTVNLFHNGFLEYFRVVVVIILSLFPNNLTYILMFVFGVAPCSASTSQK